VGKVSITGVSDIGRVPVAAGADHQHIGAVGAPGSGDIFVGLLAGFGPGLGDLVDPFPGLFRLVAAYEQGGDRKSVV
jgi:hypothetical protein